MSVVTCTEICKRPEIAEAIQAVADKVALAQDRTDHPGYLDYICEETIAAITETVDALEFPPLEDWLG